VRAFSAAGLGTGAALSSRIERLATDVSTEVKYRRGVTSVNDDAAPVRGVRQGGGGEQMPSRSPSQRPPSSSLLRDQQQRSDTDRLARGRYFKVLVCRRAARRPSHPLMKEQP